MGMGRGRKIQTLIYVLKFYLLPTVIMGRIDKRSLWRKVRGKLFLELHFSCYQLFAVQNKQLDLTSAFPLESITRTYLISK